jgi:hypothetical protein
MEQAGADALELNVYHAELDPEKSGAEIERETAVMVREVKRTVKIPVAVKLSPFFTFVRAFRSAARPGRGRRGWCCSTASTRRISMSHELTLLPGSCICPTPRNCCCDCAGSRRSHHA